MAIQTLQLFGVLPNMLESTVNPCTQGCDYCYAKNWKKENQPIDKLINRILKLEEKAEGLTPFLVKKRSPITFSNRSDLLVLDNYDEYIREIKNLGFPVYIETKGNRSIDKFLKLLDNKDHVYFSFTGKSSKFEEKNILTWQEKIDFIKQVRDAGLSYTLAINPYHPDMISVPEIHEVLDEIRPVNLVFYPYHNNSNSNQTGGAIKKNNLMTPQSQSEIMEMCKNMVSICNDRGIFYNVHRMDLYDNYDYNLDLRVKLNDELFGGNHFIFAKLNKILLDIFHGQPEIDTIEIYFDRILEIYKKEFSYFEKCIMTKSCYSGRYRKYEEYPKHFSFLDFFKYLWNKRYMRCAWDYYHDDQDDDGNLIYAKRRISYV